MALLVFRVLEEVTMLVFFICTVLPYVRSQLQVAPCPFNPLCSCKLTGEGKALFFTTPANADSVRDVLCVGVPFATLPDLSHGSVSHMDVVNSGLEIIENRALDGVQIESFRLMSNKISHIGERAFSSMSSSLKSLDLSYNELDEIPFGALKSLRNLDWLNLHSNQISDLRGELEWASLRGSLTNVFLGENSLSYLPKNILTKLQHLVWLNLDNNQISEIDRSTFPYNLQTLGLSHNLIEEFPADTMDELGVLTWLYLRGNYIENIPKYTFRTKKRMNKLDLGENFISSLPSNMFNESITIRDLNLDWNYLETLPAQAFRGLNVGRLYLSMNKLKEIDDRAFVGVGHTLEFLDLEHNYLDRVPKALSQLKKLKYLYIPSNELKELDSDSLESFSSSLISLSLSGNHLTRIPTAALSKCNALAHLNIGYNQIIQVIQEDFQGWSRELSTLLLRNNRISFLPAHLFKHAPKIRELSLSFNKINAVDPNALVDLASTLESLEISFGIYRENFPEDFLKPLTSLSWLALDNNNIRHIGDTALYSFGKLQYLNLEANRISRIAPGVLHKSIHRVLRDVRLAYNHLEVLEPETFSSLDELQTLVLTGNKLRSIKTHAVNNLQKLVTFMASNNVINHIEPRAFNNLPMLVKLDLQENELKELSLAAFQNVTNFILPLTLNISYNQLTSLFPSASGSPVYIQSLDVSHNRLNEIPVNFLETVSTSLKRLYMGYNKVSRLDDNAFGNVDHLQDLALQHNGIRALRRRAFAGAKNIQVLDLSYNHIEQLASGLMSNLTRLRLLDLSFNHIRSVPRDVFEYTKLERLDLTSNEFVVMPTSALSEVARTLRYLEISRNHIEHLDSTMFTNFPNLIGLNLAYNKLTILPDNVFLSLGNLMRLDLSDNPLRANFKELFHYLQKIKVLSLSNTGLKVAPIIPLPNLIYLNLSRNSMTDIPTNAFETLGKLRFMDVSHNALTHIPTNAWQNLNNLRKLILSNNPLKVITKETFSGIMKLQQLDVQDLPKLERFDSDSIAHLNYLKDIRIQTWPKIEKYRFRLGSTLSGMASLRKLSVKVIESKLTDQLHGAFSPRLKELEITGENLVDIHANSFEGVQNNYELVLRIRNTGITELPTGLFHILEQVPHLSLDLRDNKFSSLAPAALYTNGSNWETIGTKLIAGGLALQGNPWTCDCGLVWLGHWLRRWLRETLQIHLVMLEGAHHMQTLAREARCTDPRTGQQTPLLDLYPEDLHCHASALSHAAAARIHVVFHHWNKSFVVTIVFLVSRYVLS